MPATSSANTFVNKLFIDTDILLDLLLARVPHDVSAAQLFTLVESGKAKGYVSPLSFSNLHDILRRSLSHAEVLRHLRKLRLLMQVVALNDKVVDLALSSEFEDFEDALQYYTVVEHTMDCLITRNKKDYKHAAFPLYTAEEYLSITHINP